MQMSALAVRPSLARSQAHAAPAPRRRVLVVRAAESRAPAAVDRRSAVGAALLSGEGHTCIGWVVGHTDCRCLAAHVHEVPSCQPRITPMLPTQSHSEPSMGSAAHMRFQLRTRKHLPPVSSPPLHAGVALMGSPAIAADMPAVPEPVARSVEASIAAVPGSTAPQLGPGAEAPALRPAAPLSPATASGMVRQRTNTGI